MFIVEYTHDFTQLMKFSVKCYAKSSDEAAKVYENIVLSFRKLDFDFKDLPFNKNLYNLAEYVYDCQKNCLLVRVSHLNDVVTFYDKDDIQKCHVPLSVI